MTPEQFQRLEMLYDRAAALPEGARARFIEEQCAGDEELRRELMAAFRDAGSGLTGVVNQAAAAASGAGDQWTNYGTGQKRSPMARPSRIGPYELIEEIGRGAMGVVFRAFDPAIGRAVAIKIIRSDPFAPPVEKDELRRRFGREAGAAGKLSHPGIVTVFHLGSDGDHEYMVMELVAGQALDRLLAQGTPIEAAKVIGILRQLAGALDYAHSQGVIHRDIKPANILVSPDGAAKIGDFGIARIVSSTITQTGAVLGTPSYMAPEQIMARKIGGRADQFSLAVLAYQMLTGRRPFEAASTTEVMYQIVHAEPQPVRAANPALPSALESIFQRALSKDPDQRYASCIEFATSLERALAGIGRPVSEAQPKPQAAAWNNDAPLSTGASEGVTAEEPAWWRRHRVLAAAALGACAALALALFLAWNHGPANQLPAERKAVRDAGALPSPGGNSLPTPTKTERAGLTARSARETKKMPKESGQGVSIPVPDPAAVFAYGVGPFRFGMQPGEVVKVWKGDPSTVIWGRLARADEYNPAEVRYFGYPLKGIPKPSTPGSPLHSLAAIEPCWGGNSMLYFLFSSDGLFKISVRLVDDCGDRPVLLKQWASQYAVSATGSAGHLKFRKTVESTTLEGHYLRSAFMEVFKSGLPIPPESWWLSVLRAPDAIARVDGATKPESTAHAAEEKHTLGVQLLDQGKVQEAIAALTDAINLNPNYAEAYLDRSRAYYKLSSMDRSIEDCDHAIKLRPAYMEAFLSRGHAEFRQNKMAQAIEDYTEVIRLNPESYEAYMARGLARKNQPDLAIQDFTQLIRMKPADPVPYFRRAEAFTAQKDYDRALQDYDEAIRLRPDAHYWQGRGEVYRFQGKNQRAIQDYDEDIRRHPEDWTAYLGRSYAKQALGDTAGAAADRKRSDELKSRR